MNRLTIVLISLALLSLASAKKCSKKEGKKIRSLMEDFNVGNDMDAKSCPQYDDGQQRMQLPEKKWKKGCYKIKSSEAKDYCKEEGHTTDERMECCIAAWDLAVKGAKGKCTAKSLSILANDNKPDGCESNGVFSAVQDGYTGGIQRCCDVTLKCKTDKKNLKKFLKKVRKKVGTCDYTDDDTGIEITTSPFAIECTSDELIIRDKCKALDSIQDRPTFDRFALSCCISAWKSKYKICNKAGWGTYACLESLDAIDGCTGAGGLIGYQAGEAGTLESCYFSNLDSSQGEKECTTNADAQVSKALSEESSAVNQACYFNGYHLAVEACKGNCGNSCDNFEIDEVCSRSGFAAQSAGIADAQNECC